MDTETVTGINEACAFDMCTIEGEPDKQDEFRCESISEFNNNCLELLQNSGINKVFNWRKATNCRKLA